MEILNLFTLVFFIYLAFFQKEKKKDPEERSRRLKEALKKPLRGTLYKYNPTTGKLKVIKFKKYQRKEVRKI
jgi:hypothetical protein